MASSSAASTGNISESGSVSDLNEMSIISYLPILLSIMEAFVSSSIRIPCWRRTMSLNKLRACVRSLIPSTLILLYTSLFLQMNMNYMTWKDIRKKWQSAAFIMSFIFFTLLSIAKRRELLGPAAGGIHMNNARGKRNVYQVGQIANRMKPDERGWEQWSTRQFLQWVICTYTEQSNSNSNSNSVSTNAGDSSGGNHNGACFGVDELQSLVEILDLERISGGSIPFIQLDDLRSMGISYGEAIHLMNEMGDLMRKYPSRNQHQRVHPQVQHNHNGGYKANDGGIDLDDWLGRTIDKVPAPAPPKPSADWE